jgi:hypothetical protein
MASEVNRRTVSVEDFVFLACRYHRTYGPVPLGLHRFFQHGVAAAGLHQIVSRLVPISGLSCSPGLRRGGEYRSLPRLPLRRLLRLRFSCQGLQACGALVLEVVHQQVDRVGQQRLRRVGRRDGKDISWMRPRLAILATCGAKCTSDRAPGLGGDSSSAGREARPFAMLLAPFTLAPFGAGAVGLGCRWPHVRR